MAPTLPDAPDSPPFPRQFPIEASRDAIEASRDAIGARSGLAAAVRDY